MGTFFFAISCPPFGSGRVILADRTYAGSARRLAIRRHFEFLGGAKGDLLAGLDLDLRAGFRIAAHAGSTIPHLQNSKPGDLHSLALLQVFDDEADEVFQHHQRLRLGKLMLLRQRIGQMAHKACALTATIPKIRNSNCLCVLDTD
jgi:hypothetical protein